MSTFTITPVRTPSDLAATTALIQSYAAWLAIDLSFQDFSAEIAHMPGKYAAPTGELLLARDDATGRPLGCVGVAPLAGRAGVCEMKRLYVEPVGRGRGVGKRLAEEAVREARRLGYGTMLLDVLGKSGAARGVYRGLGFVEVERYYDSPLEDVVFFRLDL